MCFCLLVFDYGVYCFGLLQILLGLIGVVGFGVWMFVLGEFCFVSFGFWLCLDSCI